MARSVSTGWSIQTPGACPECGSEDDYGCDGRGTVRCSCDPEFDESYDTTEARREQACTCDQCPDGAIECGSEE